MNFTVEIKNLPALRKALNAYPQIAEPILQKAVEASSFIMQKNTLKDDPVPWRTGDLLIHFKLAKSRLQARWFPTSPYAIYVNNDDRTGPVRARVKTGKYVTGKSGRQYYKSAKEASWITKPRRSHFMEKILEKSQPAINETFSKASYLIAREITRRAMA